jgi:pyruvate/2-oxoglutarate dehydrogenase complex dihydrolipoamide dehydrogenase (E3) component/anti-anti-sigma regulatory factor
MPKYHDYDLLVIGAGIAGFVAAVTANGIGKKVAVIEKKKVGGNCTNFTCIPSKSLIRLAHVSKDIAHFHRMGIFSGPSPEIDGKMVMPHIRSIVQKAYEKDLPETFEKIGINVLQGVASFVDRHRIEVDGRVISAEKIIIASGTCPLVPPIKGLSDIDYLTNENLYELGELPKSIIILGGGVDGLEYASAFGRLGVETTIVEMGSRLLPMADPELTSLLVATLEADGIQILTGTKAIGLAQKNSRVILEYERPSDKHVGKIQADKVLVAIGRKPDLEDLALEKAGVDFNSRGVLANSKLQTSAPNIYACGDIIGPYQLASMAEYQGIIAASNAFSPFKQKVNYSNNVYVIFTEPTLAFIGLTEGNALKKYGHSLRTYRFSYSNMRRALIDGHTTGMAKFLCDRRGRIVGAHILGEAAAEVIHEVQVLKVMNKPLSRFHSVTHAYPTYAQALVGRVSQLVFLDKMRESIFVRLGLALLPGFSNRLNLARDRLAETEHELSSVKKATLDVVVEPQAPGCGSLHAKASFLSSTVCVVDLPQELTDFDETPFLWVCGQKGKVDLRSYILNFSQVRMMNGLGVSMLAKVSAIAASARQALLGYGLAPGFHDVMKLTELDRVVQLFATRKEALAAAQSGEQPAGSIDESELEPVEVDSSNWANLKPYLTVAFHPEGARNLNVDGLKTGSPVSGFGQMWEKTYRLFIKDSSYSPEYLVSRLKSKFPDFQPSFNHFFPSSAGIKPGEIVLIDSITPGGAVSTGVMIMYADELSFTFATPQGHPEAGWVTFSSYREEDRTVVQIYGLTRSNDPFFELAFHIAGSRIQIGIWTHVLKSLAADLGVPPEIAVNSNCVDNNMQWSFTGNIWLNSQIRTLINEPRWLYGRARKRFGQKSANGD